MNADTILTAGSYRGEVTRRTEGSGVRLVETTYRADSRYPPHAHRAAKFCFVLQGEYVEICRGAPALCRPLTLTYHPPEEYHETHFRSGAGRCFNVEVQERWLHRHGLSALLAHPSFKWRVPTVGSTVLALYRRFAATVAMSPQAVETAVVALVEGTLTGRRECEQSEAPGWLLRVRQTIDDSLDDPPSLAELARDTGRHPVHVSRTFRRFFGISLTHYVRTRRLQCACQVMIASKVSLTHVALGAGFADQSHFSRSFKEDTGMTPSAYRQMLTPAAGR